MTWLPSLLYARTVFKKKKKKYIIIIYLQCFHKYKLNKSGSAWANGIFIMPKLEGCVCTFKRSISQIQQFDICSLRVQRLPALNRTISCNCLSLVSTWLMPKYSREGKKMLWTPRLLMRSTFSEKLISGRRPNIKSFCFNISGCRRSIVKLDISECYILSGYVHLISSQKTPFHQEWLKFFFIFFLLGLFFFSLGSAGLVNWVLHKYRGLKKNLNLGPPWMWLQLCHITAF